MNAGGSHVDVAERAARSGAGLLIAAMLVWAMAGSGAQRPAAPRAALRLDPNTATRAELMLLPDIGPARADAILAERQAGGRLIETAGDLDRVRGIGPRRIEKLRPHVRTASSTHEQP
jgi:competence protein ComEA